MNVSILDYMRFRECTGAPEDVITRAFESYLAKAGRGMVDIRALIVTPADVLLCEDRSLRARLLDRLGLVNSLPVAIIPHECSGVLAAIKLACRYVRGGACRKVPLVASFDRAAQDSRRIQPFGVISDAYRVLSFAMRSDRAGTLSARQVRRKSTTRIERAPRRSS
ncbi:hypothetical protein [Rhodanobacter sp. MP1X3]|uniref:hypothetical protein n=1 Tax=Rhodanobacter sp. MP1X3 TaxID=2723086 RepID=UPI00161FEABC|nr:hypothetical protein [Rhodanobacter sp. MP1X3]MBB6244694.1 hypothetical protein [Rhodanobacter sp. MP1X3]